MGGNQTPLSVKLHCISQVLRCTQRSWGLFQKHIWIRGDLGWGLGTCISNKHSDISGPGTTLNRQVSRWLKDAKEFEDMMGELNKVVEVTHVAYNHHTIIILLYTSFFFLYAPFLSNSKTQGVVDKVGL